MQKTKKTGHKISFHTLLIERYLLIVKTKEMKKLTLLLVVLFSIVINTSNFCQIEKISAVFEEAQSGDSYYQSLMGLYMLNGFQCKIQEKEGLKWFEESAKQNHPVGRTLFYIWNQNLKEGKKSQEEFAQRYPNRRIPKNPIYNLSLIHI